MASFSRFALALMAVAAVVSAAPHRAHPEGYNPVPGGRLAHSSCVHHVANGAFAAKNNATGEWSVMAPDGTRTHLPRCAHPIIRNSRGRLGTPRAPQHGSAWIVDAMQDHNTNNGFSYFGTNFTVPTNPATQDGALLYYWPGLEDEAEGDVIQPVLQFGVGPYGGGNFWVYQSWFVSGDGTVLVGAQSGPIDSGAAVFGSLSSATDGSSYTSTAVSPAGTPNSPSVLTVATSEAQVQTRAYVTVEVYGISTDCTVLPRDNALEFTDIVLTDGAGKSVAPKFTAETQHQVCNHGIKLSGDTVTITWKS